jgi:hypothetical protein
MIERHLHGEIECDLHAVLGAGAHEPREIIERSKLRMNRVVAAFGRADRVGAARISGLRL